MNCFFSFEKCRNETPQIWQVSFTKQQSVVIATWLIQRCQKPAEIQSCQAPKFSSFMQGRRDGPQSNVVRTAKNK